MERKKRALFAVLIATIMVAAVFASFAMTLFQQKDYDIRLPDLSTGQDTDQSTDADRFSDEVIRVEVTPETVQSVIATLDRPKSYYREISIELWAGEGESALTTAAVWVDEGWSRSDVTAPNGRVQHNLVGENRRWIWYDHESTAVELPAEQEAADLIQRIPTYEDVLELSTREITAAGYEQYGDAECVCVEVEQRELGSRERYWIDVTNGLLVAAERTRDEQLLYRMTASSTESPAPLGAQFALPDGTVLHTVGSD